jgi:hypothetical protein
MLKKIVVLTLLDLNSVFHAPVALAVTAEVDSARAVVPIVSISAVTDAELVRDSFIAQA